MAKKHTVEDIVSVTVLERKKPGIFKSNSSATITFSVGFKDGVKEIIKDYVGTDLCNRLLQLAEEKPDVDIVRGGSARKKGPIELKKNQLPNGTYIIGKDIPVGIFDFTWVFGAGFIKKYPNEHETNFGSLNYNEFMSQTEYQSCLHVECKEGEMLAIEGSIIVEISRSKPVVIDL